MTILAFQRTILSWYKTNRRDLPWRNTKDPYKILVSEVMLQQTQVARVIPKYEEFLKAFPNLRILARASTPRLLKVWAGLGYWKRALALKETARTIQKNYKGKFPKDSALLDALPGIGPYTAGAVSCFAFGNAEAFLDTNIRRVYLHFFFLKRKDVSDKEILKIAEKAVWKKNPREWHYALFDYGATMLKNSGANRRSRHYTKQSKFENSFRSFRTKVVNFLLSQKQNRASKKTIESLLKESPYPTKEVISSLLKDRLIKQSSAHYFL
ncbi:MAG: A/G-specific adenine glycosylase [bacterium]|nr:A/G-specific adenine glycosylase [Candidatus Wildermuthbacteria bacterium]MDP2664445.1 A/G-specific adenine glycosylase [bacterium]